MDKNKLLKKLVQIEHAKVEDLTKNDEENDLDAILDLLEAYIVSKSKNIRENDSNALNKCLLKKWFKQITFLVKKITLTKLKKNRSLYKRYVVCKDFLDIYFDG